MKLNTVVREGTSPGSNIYHPPGYPIEKIKLGPQPKPADVEVLNDGIFRVWLNGALVMNYEDVVTRYTNAMTIDLVQFSTYFGDNSGAESAIWYDNLVVATEYIGAVNL
jgi:hypothetical protein